MESSNTEFILITEFFTPDNVGTGQRMTELAKGLHDKGLDITVYTHQPHQTGENEATSRRLPTQTTHQGVPVRRPRVPVLRQSSILRRIINWMIFTIWLSVALLLDSPEGKDRELIAVSHPPFLVIIIWLLCQARRWEYTYIVHDHYPAAAIEMGYISSDGIVAKVWKHLNKRPLSDAHLVVTLGPAMRKRILQSASNEIDPEQVHVIYNWESSSIQPLPKDANWFAKRLGVDEVFTVLYSGSISEYHNIETIIRAAPELPDTQFLIIGKGSKKGELIDLADQLDVRGKNVRFLPFQPREQLPYSLTSCDVSVVSVQSGFKGINVSAKLPTALAVGRPVLVLSQPGDDEAKIVERFDAGIHVTQGDEQGVVDAIRLWRANPDIREKHGQNAVQAFKQHFSKEKAIDAYYRLLTEQPQYGHLFSDRPVTEQRYT